MSDRDRDQDRRAPDAAPQVHGRMSFDERDTLMMYLLRHPGVFAEAKQVLTPEHFTEPYEIIWAVAWAACRDLYDQFGALPPREALETDALARVADHPGEIPPDGVDELRKFLTYIFAVGPDMLTGAYQAYGFELLHKFLKERHWIDPVRRFIQDIGDSTPADVPALLDGFKARYAQVQGASATVMEDLVPDGGWGQDAATKASTGMAFLDAAMGGGAVDGEVYGLLGTYGSGKTMLACGIAAEAADRSIEEARTLGRLPRHVFHFTYETPPDDIRQRVISYVARIHMDHLTAFPYSATLSRAGRRHPYEEELFPTDPRGEWERYNDTRPIWQTYHIANMTGARHNPKAGSGGVEEIHAELEKYRSRWGILPDTVMIDYALVCVRRLIRARGWDPDRKLRHLVGEFGDECRRLVAGHYGCKVWVLNQLSGQANKRAPGAKMSHADSAEATNFAENLWYCFCLGNKHPVDHTTVLECSKSRRSAGADGPTILQLHGHLARFVEADDRYVLDPNSRRIVKRSHGQVVAPGLGGPAPRGTARAPAGQMRGILPPE